MNLFERVKNLFYNKKDVNIKFTDYSPDFLLDLKVLTIKNSTAIICSILDLDCGDYYIARNEEGYYILTELCGELNEYYDTEIQALMRLKSLSN